MPSTPVSPNGDGSFLCNMMAGAKEVLGGAFHDSGADLNVNTEPANGNASNASMGKPKKSPVSAAAKAAKMNDTDRARERSPRRGAAASSGSSSSVGEIEALQKQAAANGRAIEDLQKKTGAVRGGVEDLQKRTGALEKKFDAIEKRIEAVEKKILDQE